MVAAVEILATVQLVDKSLLAEQRDGEVRFTAGDVRQYGWDKLRETAEEASVRTRHLAVVAVARRASPCGTRPGDVVHSTETERGNPRGGGMGAIARAG
jgi:predicted ATPase